MKIIAKKTKQHFDFDEKWLEIILTKNVLSRKDMVNLVNKFNLKFTEKDWEKRFPTKEMGIVLIFDIDKNELASVVKKILYDKYPCLLTYDEAKKIFIFLETLNEHLLNKFCISICSNKGIVSILMDEKSRQDFNKEDLLFILIKEIYGVGSIV